jgi:hypothetical protein
MPSEDKKTSFMRSQNSHMGVEGVDYFIRYGVASDDESE